MDGQFEMFPGPMAATKSAPAAKPCLREVKPKGWTHGAQYRDNRTVAVWCKCDKCIQMLNEGKIFPERVTP